MSETINIDDGIAKYILDNTNIFENIHPNYLTIFGLILNFGILYIFLNPTEDNIKNIVIIFTLLLLRWLADILDGNVARKYKKSSKIGGTLDTISDQMLIIFCIYYIVNVFNFSNWWIVIYCILSTLNIIRTNSLSDHSLLKNNDEPFISIFLINNTWLSYLLLFIFYVNNQNTI
jgi:phosphatidylserine synthase